MSHDPSNESIRQLLLRVLGAIAQDPEIKDSNGALEILRRHVVWHSGKHDTELAEAFYRMHTEVATRGANSHAKETPQRARMPRVREA